MCKCRLAAETLAGLNSTVPRTSGDHARSGTASLEHSSNEGPVSKAGKQKSIPEGPKSAQRRAKAQHRPAVPPTGSVSTAPFGNASTSVHPVLGLYVPHARRSYLRDTALKGEAAASHAGHAEQNVQAMHTLYPGPVKARKIACPETQKHAGDAARYPLPLRRVPSDSSMTVSANSNQD